MASVTFVTENKYVQLQNATLVTCLIENPVTGQTWDTGLSEIYAAAPGMNTDPGNARVGGEVSGRYVTIEVAGPVTRVSLWAVGV
jgi:hypothetical protein